MRWIDLDVIGLKRPAEQAAHRLKKVSRLRRRVRTTIATGNDGRFGDPRYRLAGR
jgi:hypothetical protein